MSSVLGKAGEIPPDTMAAFDVAGARIGVANLNGKYFGFNDVCPHRGCALVEGKLEGSTLTCPCHGSQFDVTNGALLRGPATTGIDAYELEVAGDELALKLPEEASETGFLAGVPLFAGLDSEALANLEAFTFRRTFASGQVIVEEGRTGNGLFVVLSGKVEVVKGLAQGNPRALAALGGRALRRAVPAR